MALLSFEMQSLQWQRESSRAPNEGEAPGKWWKSYLLLAVALIFILGPQPSIFLTLFTYYFVISHSKVLFLTHLGMGLLLLFMMISSLIVTLARDPGPIKALEALEEGINEDNEDGGEVDNEEMSLAEALLSHSQPEGDTSSRREHAQDPLTPLKANGEKRWCRKCWAPKPERAHHCSECNRCVLKLDHHCPWLGNRCIGARTYPSFIHFLLTGTLYAAYMFAASIPPIKYYLLKPFVMDDHDLTPFHAMTVVLLGVVFAISMGSFLSYHAYLVLTNQTTLESLTPYILLRHLPILSSPPNHVDTIESRTHGGQENTDWVRPPSTPPLDPVSSTIDVDLSLPESFPPPPYTRGAMPLNRGSSRQFAEPYRFPSPPPSSQLQRTGLGGRWQEHELNSKQRKLVREAARNIRVYDLGWRENIHQALGGGNGVREGGDSDLASTSRRKMGNRAVWIWVERIFWGGRPLGDSTIFRHNRRAEQQLRELAEQLVEASSL